MSQSVRFFSCLQTGLNSASESVAGKDGLPTSSEASVAPALRIAGIAREFSHTMFLRGPGDVLSLDPGAVRNEEPNPMARDVAPNFFPYIELNDAALPWMFTPARPGSSGRLIPWLVLIVVPKRDDINLRQLARPPGMRLSISGGAGRMLPPLKDAYAWAHVEDRSGKSDAAKAFESRPSDFIGRLMCPARLQDNTAYIAALVPSFEAGRQAGLGREITASGSTPAWDDDTEALDLPVYHHWEFSTGGEDFEALVRKLRGIPVDDSVGLHDLDISEPKGGLDIGQVMGRQHENEPILVSYHGALVSPAASLREWPDKHREPFQTSLRDTLNAPIRKPAARRPYRAVEHDPVITPPVYGSFQKDRARYQTAQWMNRANLDPQYRSNAGLGARAVRKHQEELMGRAWARAKSIDEVNRYLRQTRLALSVGTTVHKRLARLAALPYLQVTTALQSDVAAPETGKRSVANQLDSMISLPSGVLSATFRRTATITQRRVNALAMVTGDAKDTLQLRATRASLSGQAALLYDRLPSLNVGARSSKEYVYSGVKLRSDLSLERLASHVGITLERGRDTTRARKSRPRVRLLEKTADRAVLSSVDKLTARFKKKKKKKRSTHTVAAAKPAALKRVVQVATRPTKTLPPIVFERVQGLVKPPAKRLEIPRSAQLTVSFDEPAYEWLSKGNAEFLLPGFGGIAEDSVSLLVTNTAFVESYLLGLNHEMSREFAWRQFPALLNGTWFRRFWDYLGSTPRYDITPIANWRDSRRLGAGSAANDSVILVKSALFRRYPDTLVYGVPARWYPISELKKGEVRSLTRSRQVTGNGKVRLADFSDLDEIIRPTFSGRIGRSAAFFGFPKDPKTMVGTPTPQEGRGPTGYFIVFEQAPTNQRFGLDRADTFTPDRGPASADGFSWGHFAASQDALDRLGHATVSPAWANRDIDGSRWGNSAAETAKLCLQSPVRIMFHASGLMNMDAAEE